MKPKRTILCVDDNEQYLSIRKVLLETRGYRVVACSNGAQALEAFHRGGVDLVLTEEQGEELTAWLQHDFWSRKRRLAGMFTAVLVGVMFLTATLVLGDVRPESRLYVTPLADAVAGLRPGPVDGLRADHRPRSRDRGW